MIDASYDAQLDALLPNLANAKIFERVERVTYKGHGDAITYTRGSDRTFRRL